MWNHRDLEDPIQAKIESIIKKTLPDYNYGSRREDQTPLIDESQLFMPVKKIEGTANHSQTVEDCIEAWRSHATLKRQAGKRFEALIHEIEAMFLNLGIEELSIPYTTRIYLASLKQ